MSVLLFIFVDTVRHRVLDMRLALDERGSDRQNVNQMLSTPLAATL
jgi:hypothetical protein